MSDQTKIEHLLVLLNEKEELLKDRELALNDKEEEFMAQKEELNAAIDELMSKNTYLTQTLDELKQRNSELDQILYRASHDLKTPVSSTLGLINLLRLAEPTHEQQHVLDHMLKQTERMQSHLSSLSNLAIAFFYPVSPKACVIRSIVNDAWLKVKPPSSVRIQCHACDVKFVTDKLLLTLLLECLLENAVQFTPSGKMNEVTIRASLHFQILTLEIADESEEIASEQAEKIFDMFFRGSLNSKGPGLGLYTARTIARKLGGNIELVNERPRKKFMITLKEFGNCHTDAPTL